MKQKLSISWLLVPANSWLWPSEVEDMAVIALHTHAAEVEAVMLNGRHRT